MCIYCGTAKYRKIYECHFGKIPRDETGRSYEIHHIDGNRKNNDITNLKCVSIQEHYDIHYAQSDWASCYLLAVRLKLSPEDISKLSSLTQRKKIADGTHLFSNSEFKRINSNKRVADGTHNFQGDQNPVHKLVAEGKNHLQGGDIQRISNQKRIADGTHNFLDSDFQRKNALKMLESGTHNFSGKNHPNKRQSTCPHCNKTGGSVLMRRWHFDNCKFKCD